MRDVYSDSEVPMRPVYMNEPAEPIFEEDCPPSNPPEFASDNEDDDAYSTASDAPENVNSKKKLASLPEVLRRLKRSFSMVRDSFSSENRGLLWKRCWSLSDRLWKDPETGQVSFLKLFQSALVLVILVFLMNALIVTFAFWRLSTLHPSSVALNSLALTGLDGEVAKFSVTGKLADSFLMKHVHLEFIKPIVANVYLLPTEATAADALKTLLLSVSLPAGTVIDPSTLTISIEDLSVVFHDRFPMNALANVLTPRDLEDFTGLLPLLPKVAFEIEYGVATKSFWIPFWFNGTESVVIDLAKEAERALKPKKRSKETKPNLMDELQLNISNVSFKETEGFEMNTELALNHPLLPTSVTIDLPLLGANVSSANGPLFKASLPKQSIARTSLDEDLKLAFAFSIDQKNRSAITKLFYSLQNETWKENVLTFAALKSNGLGISGLPRWLETFSIELPLGPLYSTASALNLFDLKQFGKTELPHPPMDSPVAFVNFIGPSAHFADNFELQVNVNTLPLRDLVPDWVWTLPVPKFKTLLSFQSAFGDRVEVAEASLMRGDISSADSSTLALRLLFGLRAEAITSLTEFFEDTLLLPEEHSRLIVSGSPDCFLTSLLEPLALTIGPDFKLGLLHGEADFFSKLFSVIQADMDLLTLTSPAFTETIQHNVDIDVSSSKDHFEVQNKLVFAPGCAIELPFVHVSWEAFGVAVKSSSTELLKLAVESGSTRLFLDTFKNPLALFHDGGVDVKISARDCKAFVPAWLDLARDFIVSRESKIPLQLDWIAPDRSLTSKVFIPTASTFQRIFASLPVLKSSALPESWSEWFYAFASTDIKISGFRGLTTQLLLALPQLEISGRAKPLDSVAFVIAASLPKLSINLCRRALKADPFVVDDQKSKGINCFAETSIHPVKVELKLVDGQLRSVKSSLVDEFTDNMDPKLPNLIPLGVTLVDLDGLVLTLKDASERGWDQLRMSTGLLKPTTLRYLKPAMLDSTSVFLLNRLMNALGSLLPFTAHQVAHSLQKIGIPSVDPVSVFNRSDPLKCTLDLKSPNRNLVVGSVEVELPPSPEADPKPVSSSSLPDSILVNMEWEDVKIKLAHKSSYFSLHIPKGRAAMQVHKLTGAVNFDSSSFSRSFGLIFRLFLDGKHVSSLTLRQIVDQLGWWQEEQSERTKKSKKYSKNVLSLVNAREFKMTATVGERNRINSTLSLPVFLALFNTLQTRIKAVSKKAFKTGKSLKASKLPEITIHPSPLQSSLHIPCLIPILCHGKNYRNQSLHSDLSLMKVKLRISRVMQMVSDAVGHLVGILIEKLALPQHPAYMNLKVKTSVLSFGVAVNGVESMEIVVEPFSLERVSAIVYSGQVSPIPADLRTRAIRTDFFEMVVYTALSPAVKDLQKVLSPLRLDPDHKLILDPLPEYKRARNAEPGSTEAHHLPVVVSTQNLHTRHSSLLSSLFALCIPVFNLGPLDFDLKNASKLMKKLKLKPPKVEVESSDGTNLNVKISRIRIPNPLPVSLQLDKKVVIEVQYKNNPFIRASLDGKKVRISAHQSSELSAHVTLSKNAFGTNKRTGKTLLRTFISKIAFGQAVAFRIAIHWGNKHSIYIPVSLGPREVSREIFVAEKVDVAWTKANDVVQWASSGAGMVGSAFINALSFLQPTPAQSSPPRFDQIFASREFTNRRENADARAARDRPQAKPRRAAKPSRTSSTSSSSTSSSSSSQKGDTYYLRFPRAVRDDDDEAEEEIAIDEEVNSSELSYSSNSTSPVSHARPSDDDSTSDASEFYEAAVVPVDVDDEPEQGFFGWLLEAFNADGEDDSLLGDYSSAPEYDQFGERLDYDFSSTDDTALTFATALPGPVIAEPAFEFHDFPQVSSDESDSMPSLAEVPIRMSSTGNRHIIPESFVHRTYSIPSLVPNSRFHSLPSARRSSSSSSTSSTSFTIDAKVRPIKKLRRVKVAPTSRHRKKSSVKVKSASTIDPPIRLVQVDAEHVKKIPVLGHQKSSKRKHKHSSSSSSDSDSSSSSSLSSSDERKHISYYYSTRTVTSDDCPVEANGATAASVLSRAGFAFWNVANHARVRLFFRNPSEFPVYIIGGSFNVQIDDPDLIWSRQAGGGVFRRSWFSQTISANMFFAPQACHPRSLDGIKAYDPNEFLACLEANRATPVSVILPSPAETEMSAFAYLDSSLKNAQLLDEMFYHDGMCTSVVDSPLSIALDAQNGHPFVLEVMVNILRVPARPRQYGDPCRLETLCLPDSYYNHQLDELIRTRINSESVSRLRLAPGSPYLFTIDSYDGGQLWRQSRVDLNSDLVLSVRLQSRYITGQFRFDQHPSFGFIFSSQQNFAAAGQGRFGVSGLADSVALLMDPFDYAVKLIQNGGQGALMSKQYGAFPIDLSEFPLLITLRHSPRHQKLILTVAPELPEDTNLQPYHYTTVFPTNLADFFEAAHGRVFVGLTATASTSLAFTVSDWKVQTVLPRLERSKIYLDKRKPARVHSSSKLLVQLNDSCGKAINGIGFDNLKLKVMLRKVANGLEGVTDSDSDSDTGDVEVKPNDYTIHRRKDNRPRHKKSPAKFNSKKLKATDSLSLQPAEYHPQIESVTYNTKYGLFEVKFKSVFSGRFEVYLAIQDAQRRNDRVGIAEGSIERRIVAEEEEVDEDDDESKSKNSSSSSSGTDSSSSSSDSESSSTSSTSSSTSSSVSAVEAPPYYWTKVEDQELYIAPFW